MRRPLTEIPNKLYDRVIITAIPIQLAKPMQSIVHVLSFEHFLARGLEISDSMAYPLTVFGCPDVSPIPIQVQNVVPSQF